MLRFTPDGKEETSLSLPTDAGGIAGIYLSAADQIIAKANASLQLLQAGEVDPKKAVWTILAPCSFRCHVLQSSSRNTLFLYTEAANLPVTLIRLSGQPELQRCGQPHQLLEAAESTENEIQNYPQFITDDFAYFAGVTAGLQQFTYRWPLCDYGHRISLPVHPGGRWTGLNDQLFVLNTYDAHKKRSGMEVTSPEGDMKFRPSMGKHESAGTLWAPVSSSERGDRIAVDMLTIQGGNRPLDISGHVRARRIAVYDVEAGKEVASIPVYPSHRYEFEFALSPDGHRLAIWEDDTLRMINLDDSREKITEPYKDAQRLP